MPTSLDKIRTQNVIIDVQLGYHESVRIRVAKSVVESALSGNQASQNRICIITKSALNKKGGRYSWISWNALKLVEFFADGHETPSTDTNELPSSHEYYEALSLFQLQPQPPLPKNQILCECVPSSV